MLMAGGSGNSPQHRFALICLSQLVVHNLSAAQIKSLKMRFSSVLIPRISIPPVAATGCSANLSNTSNLALYLATVLNSTVSTVQQAKIRPVLP